MTENIEPIETLPKLPPRRLAAHKGDFARVLVAGGSRGMIGAPALTARSALRGGAGLVTVAVPETIQLTVAGLCECATSIPLPCEQPGLLSDEAIGPFIKAAGDCDILAVGPGMGTGRPRENFVRAAIEQDRPLVLDADGLNNLAKIEDWPRRRRCAMVLTPHPGEFARLSGLGVAEIQVGRKAAATEAMKKWQGGSGDGPADKPLVLVLKGAGTIVTDGRKIYVNTTGNPGLATGGSGDVLTGLLAGVAMQGVELFEAACLAVYVHGLAGDLAAAELTAPAMTAGDLPDFIPPAMRHIIETDETPY